MLKKIICNKIFFILTAFLLLLLRIKLGRMVSILFIPTLSADDALLVKYADLHDHFITQQTLPSLEALVKNMGFPFFINFVSFIGLNFLDAISIVWAVAAITSVILFAKSANNSNKFVWLAIYAIVLFTPAAFDYWCGVRFYRHILLTPMYFIFLNLTIILFVSNSYGSKFSIKNLILFEIILGIIFTETFYIKEDGAWLLAILVATTLACFVFVICQKNFSKKEKYIRSGALLLPLIIFWGGTNFYKHINYKYFGVYEINARTCGEKGKWVESVYKIQSDNRTASVWAPADAIVKAFEASEKLRNSPKLLDWLLHPHGYSDDITVDPIKGDFLTWLSKDGMTKAEICNSVVEQENFFREVTKEIDLAFETGRLQKDSKIQLVSSMGGMSLKEIFDLRKSVGRAYRIHVLLYKYEPGVFKEHYRHSKTPEHEKLIKNLSEMTKIDLYQKNNNVASTKKYVERIFEFYSAVQAILFIAAFIGTFWTLKKLIRREIQINSAEFFQWLITAGILILSLIYSLAISWFCEFIFAINTDIGFNSLKSYSLGLIPMLSIFEILGSYLFYTELKNKFFSVRE